MKRRSHPAPRSRNSAYHRKGKAPYIYPNWVLTGKDLPKEIAALVERARKQRHGASYDDV